MLLSLVGMTLTLPSVEYFLDFDRSSPKYAHYTLVTRNVGAKCQVLRCPPAIWITFQNKAGRDIELNQNAYSDYPHPGKGDWTVLEKGQEAVTRTISDHFDNDKRLAFISVHVNAWALKTAIPEAIDGVPILRRLDVIQFHVSSLRPPPGEGKRIPGKVLP